MANVVLQKTGEGQLGRRGCHQKIVYTKTGLFGEPHTKKKKGQNDKTYIQTWWWLAQLIAEGTAEGKRARDVRYTCVEQLAKDIGMKNYRKEKIQYKIDQDGKLCQTNSKIVN